MPINEQRIFWNWDSSNVKDHEILARCVQEGLNEIAIFAKEAEEVLEANTGDRSFDAYTGGPARVREQVRALYEYLQNLKPKFGTGLSYSWEPWDSTQTRQRIRLIRELLHYGRGTCIDWVLLLASCLASVRLNPLIIITETCSVRHAILGYWLEDRYLIDAQGRPQPVVTGQEFVEFLQNDRGRKLFGVVNATRIPPDESGQKKPFEGRYLFSVERSIFSDDLDLLPVGGYSSPIPASLRQEFLAHRIHLSDAARACRESDNQWWITDGKRAYVVREKDTTLNVYDGKNSAEWEAITHLPDSARPFVIGPVKQMDLADHRQKILWVVDIKAAREASIEPLLPRKPWSGNHPLPRAEHFQRRPELEEIRRWWQDENSYGVLALVGMGGAGKTALAHRFLAQLPGSDVQEGGVEKDETLPIPDALFVWSFYQHPDVDRCATVLYNYLTGEQAAKATFEQVQDVLSRDWRGCRVLLVFDGVEKLQVMPGGREKASGEFLPEDEPVARFLLWCCDGPRPVHVLITSRFSLTDLRQYQYRYRTGGYKQIEVEELPLESAKALLRATGVKGLEWQMDELIRKFGNHALTLELLGNYIFLSHRGDPTHVLSKDILPLESEEARVQTETRDSETSSIKLANVLQFYEELLQKDDPATLGVLQRLCLFHVISVDEQLLAEIFSQAEENVSGPLAGLSPQQIRRHLLNLCGKYRLAYGEPPENPQRFMVRRAIQDYFGRSLDTKEVHKHIHSYIRKRTEKPSFDLASPLGGPRFPRIICVGAISDSADAEKLDLLEERIHHALHADDSEDAFRVFWHKLGHYAYMGNYLGAYARGLRIAESILERVGGLWPHEKALLMNAIGLFSLELGRLDRAAAAFSAYLDKSLNIGDRWNVANAFGCLCDAWLLQGKLHLAKNAAEAYFSWALRNMRDSERFHMVKVPTERLLPPDLERLSVERTDSETLSRRDLYRALAYRGYVNLLRGEVAHAKRDFTVAERIRHVVAPDTPLDQREGVFEEEGLLREGRFEDAARHAEWNARVCQALGLTGTEMYATLIRVEARSLLGRDTLDTLEEDLERVARWAAEKAAIDLIIRHKLVSARLELREFERTGDSRHLDAASVFVKDGLRMAENCGYAINWVDLVVTRGWVRLRMGQPESAVEDALLALYGDVASGMTGAADQLCGYKWGEGDALHLLGESLLGMGRYAEARQQFRDAIRVREMIHDWQVEFSKRRLKAAVKGRNSNAQR